MDLSDLQKFISNHSKFTDTLIEKFNVIKVDDKYSDVQFIIKPRFEDWRVLAKFTDAVEING